MNPDDLAAIRARDAAYLAHAHYTESYWSAADDRRALLAEVDRLTGLLLDEGYRDGIRLAEAVNEVVGHRLTAERARLATAVAALPGFPDSGVPPRAALFVDAVRRADVLALLEGEG